MRAEVSHPPHLIDEAGLLVLGLFRGRLLVIASYLLAWPILRTTVFTKTLATHAFGCCKLVRGRCRTTTLIPGHGRFLPGVELRGGNATRLFMGEAVEAVARSHRPVPRLGVPTIAGEA